MDVSIKSYWYFTIWGDLTCMFSSLHGNCCSCDGYWHEVVTSVSYDVLNTASCNWHIFLPPIPWTSIWIKSVTLKLEAEHSCETLELTTLIMQCKIRKYHHINEFFIFVLFNKYFKWHFSFLTSIHFTISLCYNSKHSTHFPMHTEGASLQKVW